MLRKKPNYPEEPSMKDFCTANGAADPCPEGCISVGYAYTPPQCVERFYDYGSALISGTVFPDLVIPKGEYGPKESFS